VLVALALVLFLPLAGLPRFAIPVEQGLVLLVPAVAALMVAGWRRGGLWWQAVAWCGLAAWMFLRPIGSADPAWGRLVMGWGLVLAGAWGLVLLLPVPEAAEPPSFLGRAFAALGLAAAVGGVATVTIGPGLAGLRDLTLREYGRRAEELSAIVRQATAAAPGSGRTPEQVEALQTFLTQLDGLITGLPVPATTMAPAFLMLQGLAVLALSWALYHRLARTRVGPPLARLREFRFPDAFVWGIIAALVIFVIPGLAPLRGVAANLLVFFGILYVVRGVGVLWFLLRPGPVLTAALLAGTVFMPPVILAFTLGLGLGDTWIDWRRRAARPAP
jgi:hypothetical protein